MTFKKLKIIFNKFFENIVELFDFEYLLKWILFSLLIGIFVGSASAFFLQTLDVATNFRENHTWIINFLPIGGFLIGLVYHYYGKESEKGTKLLIEEIYSPKNGIPILMAPFVYIGTMITHLLGGSAGREGTALQMAGAISFQLSKPFKLVENEKRILIIVAIAAGFGSVFGTPLAGALFALEIVLIEKLKFKAILPVFLTAFFADFVTTFWNTSHTIYTISKIPSLSIQTISFSILAGIIFGFCALFYVKSIDYLGGMFKSKISFPPIRPLIGGIIVVVGIWTIGTTKYIGLGIPTISASFNHQLPFYDFSFKLLFTIITLSAGFKGGEVTPLFFIGATLGSAISFFIPLPTGLLAGMGFVAIFAAASKTPIACSIMAYELFGIECLIFVLISNLFASFFIKEQGIYYSVNLKK